MSDKQLSDGDLLAILRFHGYTEEMTAIPTVIERIHSSAKAWREKARDEAPRQPDAAARDREWARKLEAAAEYLKRSEQLYLVNLERGPHDS